MTKEKAEQQGYQALTVAYTRDEDWMMQNVIADMQRGGIDYTTVEVFEGTEVWRK